MSKRERLRDGMVENEACEEAAEKKINSSKDDVVWGEIATSYFVPADRYAHPELVFSAPAPTFFREATPRSLVF